MRPAKHMAQDSLPFVTFAKAGAHDPTSANTLDARLLGHDDLVVRPIAG